MSHLPCNRQAYILFKSPQAATAAKHKIESFGEGQQYTKKFSVSYTNPFTNPFKTLPKDGPMRNANNNRSTASGYGNSGNVSSQHTGFNNSGGGYRGNRAGGYNNRGATSSGYNRGGFQPAAGAFQGGAMGGFQNTAMGGMQQYGGFQNRGGMLGGMRSGPMGMRGGRGGMSPNGMMGMPMGNMGMPNMGAQMGGMGMGMPQMGMQGMHGFPVHPSPHTSGQYTPQVSPYVGSFSTTSVAGQSPASGVAMGPGSSAMGNPNSALNQTGSYANFAKYPSSAVPAPIIPAGLSWSPSMNPSLSQSSTLKRTSSFPGQGGFHATQVPYNPAFFQQGQGGDASWNPHGAKRTRQE